MLDKFFDKFWKFVDRFLFFIDDYWYFLLLDVSPFILFFLVFFLWAKYPNLFDFPVSL